MPALRTRANRRTGTAVSIWDTRHPDNWLDPEGGRWAVVCETHGNVSNHERREDARYFASHPDEWCEACMDVRGVQKSDYMEETNG